MRLFGMWERVVPGAPLWPLVRTIALNVLRDRSRRYEPEPTDAVPETATAFVAEDAGLARVELERVREALGELTSAQRAALLEEIGVATTGARTAADKMLRLRARRRLALLLQRAPVVVSVRSGRLADLGQWLAGLREAVVQGASCLVCVALGLGAAAAPGLVSGPAAAADVVDPKVEVLSPERGAVGVPTPADPSHSRVPARVAAPATSRSASRPRRSSDSDPEATGSGGLPTPPLPLGPEEVPLPQAHGEGSDALAAPEQPLSPPSEERETPPVPDLEEPVASTTEAVGDLAL